MTSSVVPMAGSATRVAGSVGVANLIAQYAWLVDRWDVPGIVSLFTEDGIFDLGYGRTYEGQEALSTLYGSLPWQATSHHCSQPMIECTDNTATARCAMYAMHRHPDGSEMELWGAYVDDIVRVDGVWLFRKRLIRGSVERNAEPAPGREYRFEPLPRGAGQML